MGKRGLEKRVNNVIRKNESVSKGNFMKFVYLE